MISDLICLAATDSFALLPANGRVTLEALLELSLYSTAAQTE
jgi:hypothetical protein